MDRRTPRGGGCVRRQRAGPAHREARCLHGHRRAGRHPPAQRPLRRQEVPRPCARHLRPGPARGHGHRVLPGGRQRRRVQGRVGVQPDGHPPRPAADADRAGRERRDPGLRGRGADPAGRRRGPRPAQGHGGAPVRADPAARDAGARRRSAGGVVAQRGRQGDPARRPGRPGSPRRGAAARRAPGLSDGAHPQGEGGTRAGQRLRGRPVRTARQPRDREGVRGLRRAVPGRHRLPLPGLPALRQDRDPARRPRVAHRPAYPRRPGARGRCRPGTAGAAPVAGAEVRPRPSRGCPLDVREVAGATGGVHRPGVRREAEGSAATQGRQPRLADPTRAAGGVPRPARRRRTRSSRPTPGWPRSGSPGSSG